MIVTKHGSNEYITNGCTCYSNVLTCPDDYEKIVENLVEQCDVLGEVMSDLGINDVRELYSEWERIKKNGKAT